VQVLTSCELISEGLDVPGIGAAILLRPTQSLAMALQQIGRALRPKPDGSPAVILDHAGNLHRHGLPDDPREWSLTSKRRKAKKPSKVPVKTCESCFAVVPSHVKACPSCGEPFQGAPRELPEAAPGELAEAKSRFWDAEGRPVVPRSRAEIDAAVRSCTSWDELIELRRSLGFKPGWERHAARAAGWRGLGKGYATRYIRSGSSDADGVRVLLLEDIKKLFAAKGEPEHLLTRDILKKLVAMEERPWPEWSKGKPMTPRALALLLEPFEVRPFHFRGGGAYRRSAFDDAFVLDGDAVAVAVHALIEAEEEFSGTVKALLERLGCKASELDRKAKSWPANAKALSGRLRRLAPFLRREGIEVRFTGHGRDGNGISLARRTPARYLPEEAPAATGVAASDEASPAASDLSRAIPPRQPGADR